MFSAAAMRRAWIKAALPLFDLRCMAPAVDAERIASRSARAAETGTGAAPIPPASALTEAGLTPGPVGVEGGGTGAAGGGVLGGPSGIAGGMGALEVGGAMGVPALPPPEKPLPTPLEPLPPAAEPVDPDE